MQIYIGQDPIDCAQMMGLSDVTNNFSFFHLHVLNRWSMMKNINTSNLVGICSWGSQIWPHEYLNNPIEISVKLAWIQTFMNKANLECEKVVHHALLKYGHEITEIQETKLMMSHQYSVIFHCLKISL